MAADKRTRELAAIHAAKRDLALDDDLYRDLLEQWSGKRSAADLDDRQRREVLDQLRRMGAKRKPRRSVGEHPGKPANFNKEPMLAKIEAQLAAMQLPWSYADAIAKRQTGIARVGWLRKREHLDAVIAALHVEQEKRGLLDNLQEHLKEKGMTEQELADRYGLKKGWQRRRATLKALLEKLEDLYVQP